MAEPSDWLKRRAAADARRIDKEYGKGAYGGSEWLNHHTKWKVKNAANRHVKDFNKKMEQKYEERSKAAPRTHRKGRNRMAAANAFIKSTNGPRPEASKFFIGTVAKGLNDVAKMGSSALAFGERQTRGRVLGQDAIKDSPIQRLNRGVSADRVALDKAFATNDAKAGPGLKFAGEVGEAAVAAIPQLVTAAVSAPAQAAKLGGTVVAKAAPRAVKAVSDAVRGGAKNPNYWTAFLSTVGQDYEQALSDGADENRATMYALANSLIGAGVEVGGGIQKLPGRKNLSAAKQWVDTMLEEGSEEVVQGVLSRGLENAVYGKGNKLASVSDPSAIFSVPSAAKEFGMGAAVGGILGAPSALGAVPFRVNGPSDTTTQAVPESPTKAVLDAGKRVDQAKLTNTEFDSLAMDGNYAFDASGRVYKMNPDQHIDVRTDEQVSKRNVNAFQFDHPELHGYYKAAAETLMSELYGGSKGGQIEGATGQYGQQYTWRSKRNVSPRIGALLDSGMSYDRVERALTAIINDEGTENFADAKRVELIIDDMLSDGYNDGTRFVPADEKYVNAKTDIPGNRTSERGHGLDDIDADLPYNTEQPGAEMPANEQRSETYQHYTGIGAADAGTLNSDFQNLQMESSQFHPEGANAVRVADVPMYDFDGNPISKSPASVIGAKAFPIEYVKDVEQMVADGRQSYTKRTDKQALEAARAKINQKSFDGALEEYRSAIRSGMESKDLVVLGDTLLIDAAEAKNEKAVAELLTLRSASSVNVAQAQQARSILQKMSPGAQLYGVQRVVDELNMANAKNVKLEPESAETVPETGGGDRGSEISIPQPLVRKFLEQTDQKGRDGVMEEIYQSIADQSSSSWADKWNAWRYTSMLSGPKTHVRNVVGNTGMTAMRHTKDKVGAVIEAALSKSGMEFERTKSFAVDPALYRSAWADFGANMKKALSGNRYDNDARSEIDRRKRIFEHKTLETLRKLVQNSLDAEDMFAKRINYADALAQFLSANGVTADALANGEVDSGLLTRARAYAAQEALKSTFQDRNAVSDRTNQIGKSFGVVGDAVMPFRRTPANVLARALEYSPAGFLKAVYDAKKYKGGEKELAEVVDDVAAGITGTGLFALGAKLFLSGILTVASGDDKEDEWERDHGKQDYSLVLPDGTHVSLDWFAPASLPFFAGAAFADASGESGIADAGALGKIVAFGETMKQVANPMMDMSMMQGVNDMLDSVKYARDDEDRAITSIINSAIASYLSQAVPAIFGSAERTFESERAKTFVDKDSVLPRSAQRAIGRASARVPGWDYNQVPVIDAWGQRVPTGDAMERAIANFVSPARISKAEKDEVELELERVAKATGESLYPKRAESTITHGGKDYNLSADEYVYYAESKGQTAYTTVSSIMALPEYQSADDNGKASLLKDAYSYADQVARREAIGAEPAAWVSYAGKAQADLGISPAQFIALCNVYGEKRMVGSDGRGYEKLKAVKDIGVTPSEYLEIKLNADTDGNGTVKKSEAEAALAGNPYGHDLWRFVVSNPRTKNPL